MITIYQKYPVHNVPFAAAVHELSFAVSSISVSEMLPRTPELIFVNVTTVEGWFIVNLMVLNCF